VEAKPVRPWRAAKAWASRWRAESSEPVDEQATQDVVVGVLGDSLRQARGGLVTSLCLVVVLVAIHQDWTVLGSFVTVELAGSVYAAVREILKFRSRLDKAKPLPIQAVEATHMEQPPLDGRRALVLAGAVAVGITGVVTLNGSEWVPRALAGAIALLIANGLVRPLALAYLVSRWERRHGHGRLFRPLEPTEAEERTLYVADRVVPAA
jgi:hypothetical protein